MLPLKLASATEVTSGLGTLQIHFFCDQSPPFSQRPLPLQLCPGHVWVGLPRKKTLETAGFRGSPREVKITKVIHLAPIFTKYIFFKKKFTLKMVLS